MSTSGHSSTFHEDVNSLNAKLINDIVAFWLGASINEPQAAFARRDWWYRGSERVDEEIRQRFGGVVLQACEGSLTHWETIPDGALALILLLDQFTRNLYRNTAKAYVGDERAFKIVNWTLDQKLNHRLHPVPRIWLYHPFHHSEKLEDQDFGVGLLKDLERTSTSIWRPYILRSIEGWTRHRNIVARFGRFPHRNYVLNRTSTSDELEFLEKNGESFGQGPKKGSK